MKNLRKYLIAIVIIISLIFITGCGNKQEKNDNNQANTLATKLVLTFKEAIKEEKDQKQKIVYIFFHISLYFLQNHLNIGNFTSSRSI